MGSEALYVTSYVLTPRHGESDRDRRSGAARRCDCGRLTIFANASLMWTLDAAVVDESSEILATEEHVSNRVDDGCFARDEAKLGRQPKLNRSQDWPGAGLPDGLALRDAATPNVSFEAVGRRWSARAFRRRSRFVELVREK